MATKKKESRFPSESQSEEDAELNGVAEEQQGELPEMPPSSPVGKAARAYLKVKDEMDAAIEDYKSKKGTAVAKLIEEMKKIEKDSITVDGFTFVHEHIEEQDKIKVKKPKISD